MELHSTLPRFSRKRSNYTRDTSHYGALWFECHSDRLVQSDGRLGAASFYRRGVGWIEPDVSTSRRFLFVFRRHVPPPARSPGGPTRRLFYLLIQAFMLMRRRELKHRRLFVFSFCFNVSRDSYRRLKTEFTKVACS